MLIQGKKHDETQGRKAGVQFQLFVPTEDVFR